MYVQVGRLGKVHGLDGYLRLYLDEEGYLEDAVRSGVLFIGPERSPLPYFLADLKGGKTTLVRFEEINSREKADPLAGQEVYLRQEDLSIEAIPSKGKHYERLVGYTLIDTAVGPVGTIADVEAYPQQWMAIVQHGTQQWLIPLNETFVVAIDEAARTVQTQLPEGLLEL